MADTLLSARVARQVRAILAQRKMTQERLAEATGIPMRTLARRLHSLAAVLVEPLLADLGERRVVLTPSGVLAGVPWTLLPGLAGRPVLVAQSATSWLTRSNEAWSAGCSAWLRSSGC